MDGTIGNSYNNGTAIFCYSRRYTFLYIMSQVLRAEKPKVKVDQTRSTSYAFSVLECQCEWSRSWAKSSHEATVAKTNLLFLTRRAHTTHSKAIALRNAYRIRETILKNQLNVPCKWSKWCASRLSAALTPARSRNPDICVDCRKLEYVLPHHYLKILTSGTTSCEGPWPSRPTDQVMARNK